MGTKLSKTPEDSESVHKRYTACLSRSSWLYSARSVHALRHCRRCSTCHKPLPRHTPCAMRQVSSHEPKCAGRPPGTHMCTPPHIFRRPIARCAAVVLVTVAVTGRADAVGCKSLGECTMLELDGEAQGAREQNSIIAHLSAPVPCFIAIATLWGCDYRRRRPAAAPSSIAIAMQRGARAATDYRPSSIARTRLSAGSPSSIAYLLWRMGDRDGHDSGGNDTPCATPSHNGGAT